jgi:phytoene dehydrogenase-like protein
LDADTVVANVDAQHLYRDLVDEPKHLRALDKAGQSTSGVVVLVGARGTTPNIAHHNVWFSADYEREFTQIANGELPSDPTIYACVSSITDPSQAPAGHENWFLLVNAPAGTSLDGEYSNYGNNIVNRLAQVGPDLRNRALFIETIGPMDLEKRYRAPGGAIYGTSSNGRNAAFRRPNNRGPLKGLYLVGGSSHPGGGLPMVAISARIVDDAINQDLNGTRHR